MKQQEIALYIGKFERHIANPRTSPEMRQWFNAKVDELKKQLPDCQQLSEAEKEKERSQKQKRKHNAIYRARRLGANIDTSECSIYRPYRGGGGG